MFCINAETFLGFVSWVVSSRDFKDDELPGMVPVLVQNWLKFC